jgi:uncharacterized protein (TIGR03086 family)
VPAADLDSPTPCSRWDLRELLDHTIDSLTMLTDALDAGADPADGPAPGSTSWDRAIADLAARSRRGWAVPGVMDRTFDLPIGAQPGPAMASVTLLETVVHGWDISQATGEAADIPDALARPILAFAREAVPADRGDAFAADLGIGDTPSDQLVAFLGRKPA